MAASQDVEEWKEKEDENDIDGRNRRQVNHSGGKGNDDRWVEPASEDRHRKTPKLQGFLDRVLLSRPS